MIQSLHTADAIRAVYCRAADSVCDSRGAGVGLLGLAGAADSALNLGFTRLVHRGFRVWAKNVHAHGRAGEITGQRLVVSD